jgi:LysM repeat protein
VTGRSPARLLAPLALVITAVALYAVVTSENGTTANEPDNSTIPVTTSPGKGKDGGDGDRKKAKTYTVRPGDTPSAIADRLDVSLDDLLAENPKADPNALTPGQKLKLPTQ